MIETWHAENQGRDRGKNLLMKFTLQGKVFLHCGDIGHFLSEDTFRKIGKVDILLIPVGGVYTIDAEMAKQFSEMIKPKIVVPMHYKTLAVNFDLAPLSDFTAYCSRVIMNGSSELELTDDLFESSETEMIVFDYE